MLGRVDGMLSLEPVARFPNGPVRAPTGLHWDFTGAVRGTSSTGLARGAAREPGTRERSASTRGRSTTR